MSIDLNDPILKAKIKHVLDEGLKVHTQVTVLKEGLRDSVKTLAEELDMKPKLLNRAIRSHVKTSIDEEKEDLDTVEDILTVAGKR